MSKLWSFWKDESGQGLTEYALLVALIAVALIAALYMFRNNVGFVFDTATNELSNAPQMYSTSGQPAGGS